MVANANMIDVLPNYCGRRWQTKHPIQTMCLQGATWEHRLIDMGTVLCWSGWAGVDRGEPFASFVSPDMPGWVIFMPMLKVDRWCRELPPEEIKVRIADCPECEGV